MMKRRKRKQRQIQRVYIKYDYEKVIPVFGKNGKLVEINNNTFKRFFK